MTSAIDHEYQLNQKHEFMRRRTYRGRRAIRWCVNCEKTPDISWNGGAADEGTWQYHCECGYDKAMLGEIPDIAKMKVGELVTTALARQGVESIQIQDVRQFIAPKATDSQIEFFLKFCAYENLNPFKNEVYYIPFENNRTGQTDYAIVTGIDTYRKRASQHPRYAGHQTGVIVRDREGRLQYREGEFTLPGDQLMGGWCDAYLTGAPKALRTTVKLETYDKGKNVWAKDKSLMIAKVAEGHGLKRYFPEAFTHMQSTEGLVVTDAEFDGEILGPAAIEAQVMDVPNATQSSSAPKWCPVHEGAVFIYEKHWVRGEQVSTWAHIDPDKQGPKGGRVWCELDNVGEATQPEPMQEDTLEGQEGPSEDDNVYPPLTDESTAHFGARLDALLAWAERQYGLSPEQVTGILSVSKLADIADFKAAQEEIITSQQQKGTA